MKTINFFITCAFAAAIAAGASDAKERRLPDEGAFCLERALGEPDLPDGYCMRVCAAGPKEATGESGDYAQKIRNCTTG